MSIATFNEARTLAEGRRQVAQAEAEVVFGKAMAELHRATHEARTTALAALEEAKPLADAELIADLSKWSNNPANTRPIFAARQHAYDVADAEYRTAVQAAGAEHGVLTGGEPTGPAIANRLQ